MCFEFDWFYARRQQQHGLSAPSGPCPVRGGLLGGRVLGRLYGRGPFLSPCPPFVWREPEAYGAEKFAHFGFYGFRANYHDEDTTDVYVACPLRLFLLLFPTAWILF